MVVAIALVSLQTASIAVGFTSLCKQIPDRARRSFVDQTGAAAIAMRPEARVFSESNGGEPTSRQSFTRGDPVLSSFYRWQQRGKGRPN